MDEFQRRILEIFPNEISRIILYGSYAKDTASPESDLDVLVCVRWSEAQQLWEHYWVHISDKRWQQIINSAIDSLQSGGPCISPLVVGDSLWDKNIPIIEEAKREGIVLWQNSPT